MNYICGVVEGFYGTPWRCSERKDLFARLKFLGLNTYMYAPKDDAKHRKDWREKYNAAELETLKELISSCTLNSVAFVYAVSPGIDIVFSSPNDIKMLQEKLQQVYDIGCRSFAMLFDDINPELCLTDKLEFSSSADAQAKTTNKLFDWFQLLELILFCPTEYCTTRAKPNIESSEYLNTLGTTLHDRVQILWTGPKVISKTIDGSSLESLTKVLKRKPLIWDNIHANDYDKRRVFLGPFKGRSTELYENTAGILTNPNCEYECNHIAFHSLSTWLKHAQERQVDEQYMSFESDSETFQDCGEAFRKAVESWMCSFNLTKDIVQGSLYDNEKSALSLNINSLLSEDLINSTVSNDEAGGNVDKTALHGEHCQQLKDDVSPNKKAKSSQITLNDILLLCDLFHLPYEHGEQGQQIISEFKWLKENAIDHKQPGNQLLIDQWQGRSNNFKSLCQNVTDMFQRLQDISNRRLLQQLYPYVYDVNEAVGHLCSCVKWLGSKERQNQESFLPKDPEAWFYRGGIIEEMERLLPRPDFLENSTKKPDYATPKVQTIRPYLPHDKRGLYKICLELSVNPEFYNGYPDLIGDSILGHFIEYSPELIFVVEMNDELHGFVAAHRHAKDLHEKLKGEWASKMKNKYKLINSVPSTWTVVEETINRLHTATVTTPSEVSECYEAVLTMKITDHANNKNMVTRLLQCITSFLKANIFCELTSREKEVNGVFYEDIGFRPIKLSSSTTMKPRDIFYGFSIS